MPNKPPLSPLEQKIMDVIWARGRIAAAEIKTALLPDRDFRDSTIRTVLTRLEEKGYLRHELEGRKYLYSSVEPPRSLAVRTVKQIVDRFCQGSVEALLVGMVDDEIVDARELKAIVDRLAAGNPEAGRELGPREGDEE